MADAGLAACETTQGQTTMATPSSGTRFLSAREATYHLPPDDRNLISRWLDADALEEVVAWLRPEYRTEVLEAIRPLANADAAAVHVLLLEENDPEWIAAPAELKSAVKRLSPGNTKRR